MAPEEVGHGVAPHSAPQPVGSWRTTTIAWTSAVFGAIRAYPTHCSVPHAALPAPWWPPDRCAAGLVFLWGAVPREGRHLVSSGGLLPAGTKGHVSEQYVGTATPLREHRRPGPVRVSAHLSRLLEGAGVTPAVHSHGLRQRQSCRLIVVVRTVG